MAESKPAATEAQPPTQLTAVSLFAGVGGIDLALKRAGVNVTAAVELDPAARGVLADRFPETTLFPDVTKVTADELRATGFVPERGIITAGWPCQGNSVAGARGGLADPRSGLWRHVVRLLAELSPRWFLGENVPGLLSVTDGEDFGVVLGDLAELRMGVAWRVLDAQFFGVPQRRRRVFLVGCAGDGRRPVQVLLEPEGGGGNPPQSRQAGQGVAATLTRGASSTGVSAPGRRQEDDINLVVADTLRSHPRPGSNSNGAIVVSETASTLQGGGKRGHRVDAEGAAGGHLIVHPLAVRGREGGAQIEVGPEGGPYNALRAGDGGSSRQSLVSIGFHFGSHPGAEVEMATTLTARNGDPGAVSNEVAVRRLTPMECERLQGFPDGWTATSGGQEQADSARYRQMGNAVAVPVVEWIARRMVEVA